LERKHEIKKIRLINIGATLSNFGFIVFNIEPDESMITITPVIFLKVGK
jgi:hypothetical protein